jgi:WD40 repeat protein
MPVSSPVPSFTSITVLSVDAPASAVASFKLMATTGTVSTEIEIGGIAPRRCPLCGQESAAAFGGRAKSASCGSCGFDFGRLEVVRQKPFVRADSKPSAPTCDPLDRWLSGEPMLPKRLSDWQRAVNWIRQHTRVVGTVAIALVATLSLAIGSLVAYFRTADALWLTSAERDAVATEQLNLRVALTAKTNQLQKREASLQAQLRERQALEDNLRKLQASYQENQQQRQTADQRLKEAVRAARLAIVEDFVRQVQQLHLGLPDIKLFLAAKALSITQEDGVPPIPAALQQMQELLAPVGGAELRGHECPIAQLAASRDGNWLASGDHQGSIRLWSTTSTDVTKTPKPLDGHWGRITHLEFTADNRWLVSGSADSAVHLWDLNSTDCGKKPILLKNEQGRLTSFAISDDGRWLAVAGASHVIDDVVVRLWDLHADDIAGSFVDLPGYQGELCSLAVSRSGDYIATGNKDGVVRLWQFSGGSHAITATDLHMQDEPVRAMCFAPDGRSLITAANGESGQGTIRAWNLDSIDVRDDVALADSSQGVEQLAITADGRWLFTANQQPSLQVRDLTIFDQKRQSSDLLVGQKCVVQAMALSANDRWLAAACTDNAVRLWYISANGTSATPVTIRPTRGVVTSLTFAHRGDWLATGNDRGCIQLWNLQLDDLIRTANARMSR